MSINDTNEDAEDAGVKAWLQANLPGRIVRFERHRRWRPAWFVDVLADGLITALYVRGERAEGLHTQPLEREYQVLKLLAANGVRVPRIYGWSDAPKAIFMERIDGEPYEGGAETEPSRRAAVEDYMGHLAQVHRIDVADAVAAGLHCPQGAEAVALTYFAKAEDAYHKGKIGPDPLVEFVRGWIRRHVPHHRNRPAVITSDAPQFFHRDGKVLALFDLELAQIGDPMMDLASMRLRDTMEPTGNLSALFDIYEAASGEPVDDQILSFYTVLLFMCVSMIARPQLRVAPPHPAYVEYLSWNMSTTRSTMMAMAEYLDLDLAPVEVVQPVATRQSVAMADLVAQAQTLTAEGHYREAPILSLARYLQRADAMGTRSRPSNGPKPRPC
jgi:aminoglycoside phosphotransferase (APT) family kinase protein